MTLLLKFISFLGLALTIVPAILVFIGQLPFETHRLLMLFGMIMWFGATPFWMNKKENEKAPNV